MKAFLILYPIAVFLVALSILTAQFDHSGADWPAWTQAVGSILAILAAGGAALYQGRTAQRQAERARLQSIADRAAAIAAIAVKAQDLINGFDASFVKRKSHDYFMSEYSKTSFSHVERALISIPLHELGNYDLVDGIIKLTEAMSMISEFCQDLDDDTLAQLFEQERYHLKLQEVAPLAHKGLLSVMIATRDTRLKAESH
jgi:hypothetical protein